MTSAPHTITVDALEGRAIVEIDGTVVAESDDVQVLREGSLRPRYYFAREHVRMDLLEPTDTSTRCPFKGDASYWSFVADGARHDDVVWSYEEPIVGMEAITGRLCFYDERVTLVVR